ncbi:DinB family protein [Alicyclobacillus curvatus]|nr:DinB family protein [Alicyclobacillus curvatus]
MSELLLKQYDLVRKTREALFTFFESLPGDKLHVEMPGFGYPTIADTHLHVAGCYIHWLVKFAGIRPNAEFPSDEEINAADVAALRGWFNKSDAVVEEFLNANNGRLLEPIYNDTQGPVGFTPLWLMTHTMTHEFHHKGQIVTMARQLGYVPPDTDLIFPER